MTGVQTCALPICDLGNGAAIRIAETILTNDPLFGWISYGGDLTEARRDFSIIPRDGLRSRFSIITDRTRLRIEFERDGFLEGHAVVVSRDLTRVAFTVENRTGDSHGTRVSVQPESGKSVRLTVDGKTVKPVSAENSALIFNIAITGKTHSVVISYTGANQNHP